MVNIPKKCPKCRNDMVGPFYRCDYGKESLQHKCACGYQTSTATADANHYRKPLDCIGGSLTVGKHDFWPKVEKQEG